jgi:hypothetical protein
VKAVKTKTRCFLSAEFRSLNNLEFTLLNGVSTNCVNIERKKRSTEIKKGTENERMIEKR